MNNLQWIIERAMSDAEVPVPMRGDVLRALDDRMKAEKATWFRTEGQRKAWDGLPDMANDGWVPYSWKRLEFTEEISWFKPLPDKAGTE